MGSAFGVSGDMTLELMNYMGSNNIRWGEIEILPKDN
jgi:hypothetical protein